MDCHTISVVPAGLEPPATYPEAMIYSPTKVSPMPPADVAKTMSYASVDSESSTSTFGEDSHGGSHEESKEKTSTEKTDKVVELNMRKSFLDRRGSDPSHRASVRDVSEPIARDESILAPMMNRSHSAEDDNSRRSSLPPTHLLSARRQSTETAASTATIGAVNSTRLGQRRRTLARLQLASVMPNAPPDEDACSDVVWSDQPFYDPDQYCPTSPVIVGVSCLLKTVSKVDTVNGTFHVTIGMKVNWNDPRIASKELFPLELCDLPLNLWTPNVMLPNATDVSEESLLCLDTSDVSIINRGTGLLQWHRPINATFTCPFDLRAFPFDDSNLQVRFNGSKLRDGRAANAKDVILCAGILAENHLGIMKDAPFLLLSRGLQNMIPEYEVMGVNFSCYVKGDCSIISWGICLRRCASYYGLKIISLIWILVVSSCISFIAPGDQLVGKGEFLVSVLGCVIAFLFVIGDKMPRTPFLHNMDILVLSCIGFIFVMLVEACVVYKLHERGIDESIIKTKWMVTQSVLWVAINCYLFARPIWKYTFQGEKRPAYLQQTKMYIPMKKNPCIDIWAE